MITMRTVVIKIFSNSIIRMGKCGNDSNNDNNNDNIVNELY